MKYQNLNEISSEFFPNENSSKYFLNSNTTYNKIQAYFREISKPNLDLRTSINTEEKEIIDENILKPNLESNENDTCESERLVKILPTNS